MLGAGRSGIAIACLLSQKGARVWLVDEHKPKPQSFNLDACEVHCRFSIRSLDFEEWTLAIVSPGIAADSWMLNELKQRKIPVIAEIEMAYRLDKSSIIAITGTNGKTTTTRLIEAMLRQSGRKAMAAGNIGHPYSAAVRQSSADWIALEVSSFQLEHIDAFAAHIAILLNLTPDHLDRHSSLENYYRSKARIFENQKPGDWSILQWEAMQKIERIGILPKSRMLTFSSNNSHNSSADLFYEEGWIVSRIPDWEGAIYECSRGTLLGMHNVENQMAAILAGYVLGVPLREIQIALDAFCSDAHRLEMLASIDGITIVNDSKSTNPASLKAAMCAMKEMKNAHLWLLVGGANKHLPFDDLVSLVKQKVSGMFLFGQSRNELAKLFSQSTDCVLTENLEDAFVAAFDRARFGDAIVLSPGCSSFDQFESYAERGALFKSIVQRIHKARRTESQITKLLNSPSNLQTNNTYEIQSTALN